MIYLWIEVLLSKRMDNSYDIRLRISQLSIAK